MNMLGKFQDQLSDKFENLFDSVINSRVNFFNDNPDKKPGIDNVNKIISNYANSNAVVTGGLSLVPGPWAVATAIPEVVLLVRNQAMMIYEIGVAYGKEKSMNRDLILSIMVSSLGVGGIGLATAQLNKFLMKKVMVSGFETMLPAFTQKISQQVLRSIIGGFIPVIGSAALAAWSRYYTKRIGMQAVAYFSGEGERAEEDDVQFAEATRIVEDEIARLKLRAFINLIRTDGSVSRLEKDYIKPLIESSDLNEMEKTTLLEALNHHDNFDVDFSYFKDRPNYARTLLNEMVALAKRDANINQAEKSYIREVGSILGYSDNEINELMTF